MKNYFLLYALLCTSLLLQATIVEHNTIDSVLQYIDTPNILVVFDIDNTLATSSMEIGSDQWFSYLIAQKQKEGFELDHAINLVLPTYFHVQFKIPLVPVENNTVAILDQLHQKKVPTIALTARSLYIADRTLEQLENINIHLSIPGIQQNEMVLTLPTKIPSMYKDGILFSGNNTKGDVLAEFFKETNYYPAKVIFIDDKEKYLKSVEQSLETLPVPPKFIGIRYGGCDERVKNFNPEKAEQEFAEFKANLLQPQNSHNIFSRIYEWTSSFMQRYKYAITG